MTADASYGKVGERVVVMIMRSFRSWNAGDTAGFLPSEAENLIRRGFALAINPETGEVIQPEPEPETPDANKDGEKIAIPADWETMPFLSRVALAKQFDADVTAAKEPVHKAIEAELARRAGDADTQTPNEE